jgi:hypothetical protein
MKTKIWFCLFLMLGIVAMRAQEVSFDKAPPADRVAHLAAVGDYAGIEKISEDIDQQSKGVHNLAYFQNLLDVIIGLGRDARKMSYERRWAIRKLQWKILLTKHSNTRDAHEVFLLKRMQVLLALYGGLTWQRTSLHADEDQFVALRRDAAALLWSYRDCLQQWIIPNYKDKPVIGMMSIVMPPGKAADEFEAKLKKLRPVSKQNEYDNMEQSELKSELYGLNQYATSFIRSEYSWPPADDATIVKLLETFPPYWFSREQLLKEVHDRQQQLLKDDPKSVEEALQRVVMKPQSVPQIDERVAAVRYLGAHRVAEAVPLLVEHLTEIKPFIVHNSLDFEDTFPASAALAQIGEPAVEPLKALLEKTNARPDRLLIVYILLKIKGRKWTTTYLTEASQAGKSEISAADVEELKGWVNRQEDVDQ